MEARVEQEFDVTHEWMGCEEVNDWFIATCSCGWTYQHPNYGSSQDTFVNHWGDHILATLRADETKAAEKLAELRVANEVYREGVEFVIGGLRAELARERERHQHATEEEIDLIANTQRRNAFSVRAILFAFVNMRALLEPKAEPAPALAAQLWTGFEILDSIRASLAQAAELGTLEGVGGDIEVMNSVQILMDKAAKRGTE